MTASEGASIALALVAIGQATYFFIKSKDSEKTVETALDGIRQQTETLQKIAGRQLDRLTKFVTEPRPIEERPTEPGPESLLVCLKRLYLRLGLWSPLLQFLGMKRLYDLLLVICIPL